MTCSEQREKRDRERILRSRTLQEALKYRTDYKDARVIAGGTDILVNLRKEKGYLSRSLKGVVLLDISNLKELNYLRLAESIIEKGNTVEQGTGPGAGCEGESGRRSQRQIELGSLVTHSRLLADKLSRGHLPLLVEAAATIGSTQIRNRGTVGGNICNASPAADLIPPLLVYRAEVVLSSRDGERVLPLDQLVTGPYRTALKGDELLTMVRIPLTGANYRGKFLKIGRRQALNIARVNLAILVGLDERGVLADCRVVPGAVTPYPCRFTAVEENLNGQKITELNLEKIGELAAGEMVSIAGERWSTPYKKLALASLVRRGIRGIKEEWLEEGGYDEGD